MTDKCKLEKKNGKCDKKKNVKRAIDWLLRKLLKKKKKYNVGYRIKRKIVTRPTAYY